MATVVILNPADPEPFVRLRGELKNPKKLLTRIGAILEAGAQQAFDEQRFGEFVWPPRYPDQPDPFINVAGAVQDFEGGRNEPKGRRFDRRPAVRDTGELMGSIRSRVVGADTVEVGSSLERAAAHQWGLESSQPFTSSGKKRLAKWLLTERGKPYMGKMIPLLMPGKTEHTTDVVQRPFLGVTADMEGDIQRTTEEYVAEVAAGGNS